MVFSKTTLPNGLRVVTSPMPSFVSATVQIMVRAGSRNETQKTNGIAHFLEHMVFKGTKNFPTAREISTLIDGIGGEINANTGKERTAYYIKAWDRYLNLSFDILSGFVKNPLLDQSEMEKEKGVILEEIAMYDDLPMQKAADVYENLLYDGKPLGWDILGTRETIQNMQTKDFVDYMRQYYQPQNMVLTVAGKFDTDEVLEMADKYFGDLENLNDIPKMATVKNPEVNPSKKPELMVINKKIEQTHLVLGVRTNYQGHPDRYKESVLNAILGGGMSSRMWSEIREKRALAYYVRTYFDRYVDCGYFATRAGVKTKQAEEAVKVILDEFRKLPTKNLEDSITAEEVAKAKEHMKGGLALDLEDTHSVAEFIGNQELFENNIRTLEEIMAGIDRVTVEEVQEVCKKFFQNDRLNLVVVGPVEDEEKFKELLKL